MGKQSELYQHALTELRMKGLIGSGSSLPNTSSAVALSTVEVFADFKDSVRSTAAAEACIVLIRELLVRLPLRQVVPDIHDFGLDLATRLLNHLPLSPLTGAQDEWATRAKVVRNKRCPRVFRSGGDAFDEIDRAPKLITFPYYPPTRP